MAELTHLSNDEALRIAAGLASPEEQARTDEHVTGCATCAARLAKVVEEREAFLAANPPDMRARQLLAAAAPRPRARLRWLWAAVPAALVIGVVVFVRSGSHDQRPDVLAKGTPAVGFRVRHVVTGDTTDGRSGDAFHAGDAIQLELDLGGRAHAAVYAMDHLGVVTPVFEVTSAQPAAPSSLVLDDAPDPERLFVIFSDHPIATEQVVAAAARAFARGHDVEAIETFDLGEDVVRSILVRKTGRP